MKLEGKDFYKRVSTLGMTNPSWFTVVLLVLHSIVVITGVVATSEVFVQVLVFVC